MHGPFCNEIDANKFRNEKKPRAYGQNHDKVFVKIPSIAKIANISYPNQTNIESELFPVPLMNKNMSDVSMQLLNDYISLLGSNLGLNRRPKESRHGQSTYPHVRYPHEKCIIKGTTMATNPLLRLCFSWGYLTWG